MFKKKNRIQFSNELLVVLKVIVSWDKSKSIMTYLNSNKNIKIILENDNFNYKILIVKLTKQL